MVCPISERRSISLIDSIQSTKCVTARETRLFRAFNLFFWRFPSIYSVLIFIPNSKSKSRRIIWSNKLILIRNRGISYSFKSLVLNIVIIKFHQATSRFWILHQTICRSSVRFHDLYKLLPRDNWQIVTFKASQQVIRFFRKQLVTRSNQ